MARAKEPKNGKLEEAMVLLIQNQAMFLSEKREMDKELADLRRQNAHQFERIDERFARIEQVLAEIQRVLRDHQRTLDHLPEAVREKIGFK
jgi:hypothetical protein